MRRIVFSIFLLLPMICVAADRDPRVGFYSAPAVERAAVASKNQISMQQQIVSLGDAMSPSVKQEPAAVAIIADEVKPGKKNTRDSERAACLANNIGVGNTFVWASRYSDTSGYATLLEDTTNPDNNVCFVKVDIRSDDSRIDTSDLPSKYFEWGKLIECGSWVDENMLQDRILAAKKKGRTWATIGGAVGGAAVGVGSMELFGNRLIDGKVMGQKDSSLSRTEILRSQMMDMKRHKDPRYDEIRGYLQELERACRDSANPKCTEYDYKLLLQI